MKTSSTAEWTLILGALILLLIAGRLDLLIVLIPAAALLAYGITRFPQDKTGMPSGLK